MDPRYRLVLASASPARLATLRQAGLDPEVIVSGVDETGIDAPTVPELVQTLARMKGESVANVLNSATSPTIVVGCDSLLELDGRPLGKPADAADAILRWRRMRGRTGILHTGHHVIVTTDATSHARTEVASTTVHFADITDTEIDAYVATGEPLVVAGAFTVDGFGGAFVTGIEGDHHNVVGISLPLLRRMLADLGIAWADLWTSPTSA